MSELSADDAAELARRRAYDAFKTHMHQFHKDGHLYDFYLEMTDQFLIECGASPKTARRIGQIMVWISSVYIKAHGWFTWAVAIALILAVAGAVGTIVAKDMLPAAGQ